MKKFLSLLLSITLLTGCDLFGSKEEEVQVDYPALFTEYTQAHRDAWAEIIIDFIPEIRSYPMNASILNLEGKMNMPGLAGVGGDVTFAVDAESESDMTDPTSPRISSLLNIDVNIDGTEYAGTISGTMKMLVADLQLYASLLNVEADIPSVSTSELLSPITPHLKKWYADSFETLQVMTNGEIDLKSLFTQNITGTSEMRDRLREIIQKTELFVLMKGLPEENGYLRFEVRVDTEALKKMILEIAELGSLQKKELQEMESTLTQKFSSVDVTGVLSIFKSDPEYFTFAGTATDSTAPDADVHFDVQYFEESKTFRMNTDTPDGEYSYMVLDITQDQGMNTFEIYGGNTPEEKETALLGKMSDNIFEMAIMNSGEGTETKISLTEEDGFWGGELTNSTTPGMVYVISSLSFEPEAFTLHLLQKDGENEIAEFDVEYSLEEVNSVDIEIPEETSSFDHLFESFLPYLQMGFPGVKTEESVIDRLTDTENEGIEGESQSEGEEEEIMN